MPNKRFLLGLLFGFVFGFALFFCSKSVPEESNLSYQPVATTYTF